MFIFQKAGNLLYSTIVFPYLKRNAYFMKAKRIYLSALILVPGIVLLCFFMGRDRHLEFHPSWNETERADIQLCYDRFCSPKSQMNLSICDEWIENQSFTKSTIINSAFKKFYQSSKPFSISILESYLLRDTREMIKQTALTGNASHMDKNHNSLLHLALATGFYDLAESLIKRGADVNQQSQLFENPTDTPLSWAIYNREADTGAPIPIKRCRKITEVLLAHGADIKAPAVAGLPVTIQGIISISSISDAEEKEEAIDFLIYLFEKGAPTEWTSPSGKKLSALSLTLRFNHYNRLIHYLLEHGAKPEEILSPSEQDDLKALLEEEEEKLQQTVLQQS